MLSRQILRTIPKEIRRNYGVTAPALAQATDPIQQLFIDKIREYKSKSAGGKFVDASPEVEKALKAEREKIAKQFGAEGQDMTSLPKLSFPEPHVEVNTKSQ